MRNFFLILIATLGFFVFLEINLTPTIIAVAEAKTQLMATKIINEAVYRNVSNINYQDIMSIHKDNQDRIVLMMPDTVKINKLAAMTSLDIEKELNQLETQGFSVPLGLITGSALFSDTGPPINIGIVPAGTIDVDVNDEFVEAGINQTKHRIYLNVKTSLKVVVPLMSSTINVAVQVPVTESIIIGPVPEWYMKFNSQQDPVVPNLNISPGALTEE
ncbi:sporulation protein YunB [Candidatus Formimonas warabiya]|uniref:Sporulation protein YunB n=2 Tax=Formimonas warabiya TaxID=1761012 RepID=A0A3G1L112_FORW1|nr:sporulation protein YunB [Candidatus Formimonas warabiya]